jgi:hypothetical protein
MIFLNVLRKKLVYVYSNRQVILMIVDMEELRTFMMFVATKVSQLSHSRTHLGCCSADSDFAYHIEETP